jgi:PAS domain S-box-containing protein
VTQAGPAELVARARDLVCVVDAGGRIAYVNPATERLLGWKAEALTQRFLLNFVHPDDVRSVQEAHAALAPGRPHASTAFRVRARDRSWRWLEAETTAWFSASGALDGVQAIARDVTVRRAAEAHLRRDTTRLDTLVHAATGGILMEDADRRITVVSQAFCSMFAIATRPSALVGSAAQPALAAVARLVSAGDAQDEAAIARGAPVKGARLHLVDGRTVERDYVPIGDRAAEGHLWIFRDVSASQRFEAELREARDTALAAVTAKSEFIATMSHEIRTPLSGIAGAAALLLDAGLGAPEQELASIVAEAAESLGALLGDVLDVSRIEAGLVDLAEDDYDLRQLLAAVAGILAPTIRGRPVELVVDVDPQVPGYLSGDTARVRQIVMNLAGNAVKYTERGTVRLTAAVQGDRLHIRVADTGPGISEDLLGRLFEPWTRGHGREWAGTGLGLGIARRLARAMAGDVTATSTVGEGSEFTFELPLREGSPVALPERRERDDPTGARVLVAEDNRALRLLLGRQLARLGVRATLVDDGAAAVAAAEHGGFDAILLDLRMPTVGGLEATRRIRAAGHATVPILALTADTSAEDAAMCAAAGMDGHLPKPVSLDALRHALSGLGRPSARPSVLVDERQLEELADGLGGTDHLDALLHVFEADLESQLVTLEQAVADGDAEAVREGSHALYSGASAYGAVAVAGLARSLEAEARAGDLRGASEALRELGVVVAATRAELAERDRP